MQELLTCVCVSLCTTVVHNTAQSSSYYLPSYPPDKHQSSDAVYCRDGEAAFLRVRYPTTSVSMLTVQIIPQQYNKGVSNEPLTFTPGVKGTQQALHRAGK